MIQNERKIKLRAYSPSRKEWFVFVVESSKEDMQKASHINFAGSVYAMLKKEGLTNWGQFTGCIDKNGVDIFEGDIVRDESTDDEYPICWNEEGGCWASSKEELPKYGHYKSLEKSLEVIGNIYKE